MRRRGRIAPLSTVRSVSRCGKCLWPNLPCLLRKFAHNISYVQLTTWHFASQRTEKSVSCDEKIVLSLTDFKKSNCFATLIFDKRILPYSPRGGIQMFREALAPARNSWAHLRGSVVRMRIYQSIANQRLFRNPTDLRQFFRHSSRINLFSEAKLLFDIWT